MIGKNAETAPEIGGDGISVAIDRLVAGHEKNALFEKVPGSVPYASELNALMRISASPMPFGRTSSAA